MASLTLKNVPDRLRRALKANAKMHRRSLNGEIISCLEQAVGTARIDPDEFLAEVDRLRAGVKGPKLTERWLRRAREAGRP